MCSNTSVSGSSSTPVTDRQDARVRRVISGCKLSLWGCVQFDVILARKMVNAIQRTFVDVMKLRKQEPGGRLLRTSPAVGIALLILTFPAGLAAQNAVSGGVVPPGIYANHEKVAAALSKGGPLIDNPNTPAAIKVSGS